MNAEKVSRVELEKYVTKIMLDMGVLAHLKGYHYLSEAIVTSEHDMEIVSSVKNLFVPTIGNKFF